MKKKRLLTLFLLCMALAVMTGCRAETQEKNTAAVDNGLNQYDLSVLPADFFHKTCLDVLGKFTSQYHDSEIDAPDYAATRLDTFTVRTAAHSTNIARIDIKFTFDDGDTVHSQSITVLDGRVFSYISSSPKPTAPVPGIHTISLSDFIAAIEGVDFGSFDEIKPDADLYTVDFEGVSDVFYNNEGNVIRYLVSTDGMTGGNREEDIQLDHCVPVIMFSDYIESEPGQFLGESAVQIYINK